MAERGSRKIPVTDRQFLWVQDDDKGEVILHVGPTMVSPTAADRVVVDDGNGGFREATTGQPQRMVELSDSQYAVMFNPLADQLDGEGSNGKFKQGRNESRPLRNGTRDMIPGPCSFFLRPGQRVEVRDAHELASNQYLVVKVYGDVDVGAPYYKITARSAAITTATAEDVSGASTTTLEGAEPAELTRGQLIVIRGLDTQFYIPPTGVDVVPDLTVDGSGTKLTAAAARKILSSMPIPDAKPAPAAAEVDFDDVDLDEMLAEEAPEPAKRAKKRRKKGEAQAAARYGVEQAARARHQVQRLSVGVPEAAADADLLSPSDIRALLSSDVHRQALEREVRKSRLVRDAVVLSEKEFCVILDADGKRQIKRGPARVFPGPYDSFMTKGSSDRIYFAYELLPQRALWLRFIAPVDKNKLESLLPRGVAVGEDMYAGDELILTGVNSFFFPINEVEILHPLTGRPHVGNDHSDIFIEAIGIDQKSGIYVRDLSTGEARLVRGKQSYLVDPRKEVHITRTVSGDEWNLWIAADDPNRAVHDSQTTPWAISIIVPHNTAVLATSADGQRVIEGPCVELLGYEERLARMSLSTDTPKTDDHKLRTCFLRTVGNRVSDVIPLETADFVKLDVRVSYQVTFDKQHKSRWFNHENYVGLLCDHLRSLVRGRARQLSLIELWPNIPSVIRDTILGERTEAGRAGRLFEENGMRVTEVEVLTSEILDEEIADLLEGVQRESVALVIGDGQASEHLRSQKLRHEIEREQLEMERVASERKAALESVVRQLAHEARLANLRGEEAAVRESAELSAVREKIVLEARIGRDDIASSAAVDRERLAHAANVDMTKLSHDEEQTYQLALSRIEMALIEARSAASVAERQAVQPALVEALTALGDKQVLGEVANNMNLVSLFKGKDVATIFSELLGGTRVGKTIETMLPPAKKNGHNVTPSTPDETERAT
jgi:hypothetical protein